MTAILYVVSLSGAVPAAFAATPVEDLFSSGSGQHTASDISLYGVVGQSSPLGLAESSVGTRLLSGNLLASGGIGASSEQDSDGDGTLDDEDAFPLDPEEDTDTDNDGIGNNADEDDDNDGMPDDWEVANGLDPLSDDSSLDPDNDGFTNIEEYNEGSDPHDSGSPIFPWELFYPAFIKK